MFRKLSELLESDKISKEVAEEIDAEISVSTKGLKDDREKLQKELKDQSDKYNALFKESGDYEKQIQEKDEQIKKAKDEGKNELVADLEKLRAEYNEKQDFALNLESRNKELVIENALQKTLSNYDVVDNDVILSSLKSSVSVNDDGSLMFGDKAIDDGIKDFFDSKPRLLNSKGNGGTGVQGGQGGSGQNTKSREDFEKMGAGQRSEFLKSGGKVA